MNHSNHNSKMMWLMMASCLLLPLGLLFFGGRSSDIGANWRWFALIAAFILIHVVMMFGHGRDRSENEAEEVQAPEKSNIHNH